MSSDFRAHRPTRDEIAAATGKTVPDVIAPDLRVLFCGINPGLYTAAVGFHFARPGKRFWRSLPAPGFTDCRRPVLRLDRDIRQPNRSRDRPSAISD